MSQRFIFVIWSLGLFAFYTCCNNKLNAQPVLAQERQAQEQNTFLGLRPVYYLEIDFLSQSNSAQVYESVAVTNTTSENWRYLVFSVPPAATPHVFKLNSLTIEIFAIEQPASFRWEGIMLFIELPFELRPQTSIVIRFSFWLYPLRLKGTEVHPAGNLGYDGTVYQFGDFYPVLTPYDQAKGFRTWSYKAWGDPYVYVISDVNVRIKTDVDLLIAAYGLVTHYQNLWEFRQKGVRAFAFCASRYYDFISDEVEGIPIYCYFVRGYEKAAQFTMMVAKQALPLYSRFFGPYHYQELVMAQNAYASAMEYSGFFTIANIHFRNYRPASPQLLIYIVVHELGHQWWYGAVGNDQVKEFWLDEGLTRFSEFFYFREYQPAYLGWWESMLKVKWPQGYYIDDSLEVFTNSHDYTRLTYGIAPAFFKELYELIGEEAMLAFLKDYYQAGTDSLMRGKDFFRILGRHTQVNITPLLKKYFRAPP